MKKFTLFIIAAFMAVVGYAQKPMQQAPVILVLPTWCSTMTLRLQP